MQPCHTPHQAAKPREKGGNPVDPGTFQLQLKATTLCWGRAKSGCLLMDQAAAGTAHVVQTARQCFFRSVLKESFWCFFTALKLELTAADQDTAKSKQKLLGAAPQAVVVESQLQPPPAQAVEEGDTPVFGQLEHI